MIINHGLILNKAFAPNNVKELIALAKSKPGEINYGTYGIGSSGHLNMVLFETMTGVKLQAVHYKGAAPATQRRASRAISRWASSAPAPRCRCGRAASSS